MSPDDRDGQEKTGGAPVKISTIEWDRHLAGKIWLIASIVVGGIFIVLYIISGFAVEDDVTRFDIINNGKFSYLSLGLLAIASYGFFASYDYRVTFQQEQKFGELLRDLAEYWKVGLSMSQAINTLGKGEYGILNKEIKKMSTQLSWGMAFNDVLLWLANQLNTKLAHRSISLILEANKAGGKISEVLVTAAKDANDICWLKLERQKGMSMYVYVIYISFGVYLAVILILVTSFLPAIIDASSAIIESEAGGSGGGTASLGNMEIRAIEENFIVFLFYWSVIIQSFGNGLMAGIMGYGRVSVGLSHAFIMVTLGWVAFLSTGLPQFVF